MLSTLLYANFSVAVNENFNTETRFKKYWKRRYWLKTLEKQEFTHLHIQYFLKQIFAIGWYFDKNKIDVKNGLLILFLFNFDGIYYT